MHVNADCTSRIGYNECSVVSSRAHATIALITTVALLTILSLAVSGLLGSHYFGATHPLGLGLVAGLSGLTAIAVTGVSVKHFYFTRFSEPTRPGSPEPVVEQREPTRPGSPEPVVEQREPTRQTPVSGQICLVPSRMPPFQQDLTRERLEIIEADKEHFLACGFDVTSLREFPTETEIQKACRKQSLIYHSDRGLEGGMTEGQRAAKWNAIERAKIYFKSRWHPQEALFHQMIEYRRIIIDVLNYNFFTPVDIEFLERFPGYTAMDVVKHVRKERMLPPDTFKDLVLKAILYRDLEMIRFIFQDCIPMHFEAFKECIFAAAAQGDVAIVECLFGIHTVQTVLAEISKTAFWVAVEKGKVDMVNWLCRDTVPVELELFKTAISSTVVRNDHAMIACLFELGRARGVLADISNLAFTTAVAKDRIEVAQWLHTMNAPVSPECFKDAFALAAANGTTDMVRCLLRMCWAEALEEIANAAFKTAAWNNRIEILQILHTSVSPECFKDTFALAAMNGATEMVRYLLENGRAEDLEEISSSPSFEIAFGEAAKNNNLDLVSYLFFNDKIHITLKVFEYGVRMASAASTSDALNWLLRCEQFATVDTLGQAIFYAKRAEETQIVLHYLHQTYSERFPKLFEEVGNRN